VREVLRHEVHLARPLHLQQLRLAHDVGGRERPVPAAHERDGAEGAAVVAPLAHLEVPHVRQLAGEQADAGMDRGRLADQAALHELRHEAVHLARAEEQVHLGERVRELALVTLDHAADRDHRLRPARLLQAPGFDDGVDALLLRGVDEAAGVHEDDVGVLGPVSGLGAPVGELREIPLGVDRILVTPEGDDGNLHR